MLKIMIIMELLSIIGFDNKYLQISITYNFGEEQQTRIDRKECTG